MLQKKITSVIRRSHYPFEENFDHQRAEKGNHFDHPRVKKTCGGQIFLGFSF